MFCSRRTVRARCKCQGLFAIFSARLTKSIHSCFVLGRRRSWPYPRGSLAPPRPHCDGARREEEKSRAKERIFSFRDRFHQWDPKNQRPELWSQYNGKINEGESIRVFPLSNWTELDIWQYIHLEQIEVVPLYFAKPRPVVVRNGTLIMIDDDRIPHTKEEVEIRTVRFRTLGCYPLSGAIESSAATVPEIIQEMMLTRMSERENRLIDKDEEGSMERKKREGYF